MDALRPYVSRIIAPFIAAFVVWLVHFGITLPSDAAGNLTTYAVIVIFAIVSALSGIIHKLIDKKVNPADAAASSLVKEGRIMSTRGLTRDTAQYLNERHPNK